MDFDRINNFDICCIFDAPKEIITAQSPLIVKILHERSKRGTEALNVAGLVGNAYGQSSSRANYTAYALWSGD
jgi:hypothetical protein